MANPISLAILNLLGGAGQAYNQGISKGREQELGLQDRLIGLREARTGREFQAGEAEKGRTFQAGQAGEERKFQGEQTEKGQIFQKGLQEDTQTFTSGENALNRAEQERLQGMESSTSLRVARINQGIDVDPFIRAQNAHDEAVKFYREHPEYLPKGSSIEAEGLKAYRSAIDMVKGQGIFDPNFGQEPPDLSQGDYSRAIGPRPFPANPYTPIWGAVKGAVPPAYGISPFILDLISGNAEKTPITRTEP